MLLLGTADALAQTNVPPSAISRIALKSGESWEIGLAYSVRNCRSIMTAKPEIEVLEGAPEITVTIKEGEVVPRQQGCANKVPGGTIVAAAGKVTETKLIRLIARVKYKTKEGDRQSAVVYDISLVP
jgi:hypothetical protein